MRALLDARKKVSVALDALRWGERAACEARLVEAHGLLGDALRREAELRRENERLKRQLAAKDKAAAEQDADVVKTSGLLAIEINKGA